MTEPARDHVLETIHQAAVDKPKGTQGVFELPCGFLDAEGNLHTEAEVREITGHEEDLLGSKTVPNHKKIGMLVARCLTRIGTFTDRGQISTIAEQLTVGDRVFLMFAIRRTSLGDEYPFRHTCPECKYSGLFNLDLSELEIKKMADPKKRVFDAKMPSGKVVRFRPLIGRDEEKLSKASNSDDAMTLAILARLEMLDDGPPTLATVKGLGLRDRNFLRDAFEDAEGGVDTTMEMQCPNCGHEFDHDLDVGQAGFFFPSSVQKGSKKRSSL
jgi:hypothetical protein